MPSTEQVNYPPPAIWLELAIKYDLPEFYAEPIQIPNFECIQLTSAPEEQDHSNPWTPSPEEATDG